MGEFKEIITLNWHSEGCQIIRSLLNREFSKRQMFYNV